MGGSGQGAAGMRARVSDAGVSGAGPPGGPVARGRGLRLVLVVAVLPSLLGLSRAARAVEEDTVGWWIYAGAVRGPLLSRFLGPEAATEAQAAITRAGRDCGLTARIDARDAFAATPPGAAPVVFGPFLSRARVAASLACIRRYVPSAFVTQADPPT
jgi:hypothetical protein